MPTDPSNPTDFTIVPAEQLDADVNGAASAVSVPASTSGSTAPDPATLERLVALGKVGTVLWERANDNTFETDYLVALQDLAEFEGGITKLTLEPVVKKGMTDLISYLRQKVQKRMRNAINGTEAA